MIDRLVHADLREIELFHVRMEFSHTVGDVGLFRWDKLFHLAPVVWQIVVARIVHRVDVLYYPPAPPHMLPMLRDMIILIATRWMFRCTIFHMHACGLAGIYSRLWFPLRLLFRWAYFDADAVVRLAESTPDDAYGLRARREFFVANCADDDYGRWVRNATGSEEPVQLLYLGMVAESKGILMLIESCRQLVERGVDFHLKIVGECQPVEFAEEMRQTLEDASLERHVEWAGPRTGDEKNRMLAEADIFCFPSHYPVEGFPCVVLEAMSFALPVVTTRWRAIPSIVEDEVTAFLIDIHDVTALRDRMEQLIRDALLRERMGWAGRQRYLAKFTPDVHIRMMENVFQSVRADQSSQLKRPANSREASGTTIEVGTQ